MKTKQRYDLDELLKAMDVIKNFNKLELENLDFYFKGKRIRVPKYNIEEFKYMGLNSECSHPLKRVGV
jgi:hypothetical protein